MGLSRYRNQCMDLFGCHTLWAFLSTAGYGPYGKPSYGPYGKSGYGDFGVPWSSWMTSSEVEVMPPRGTPSWTRSSAVPSDLLPHTGVRQFTTPGARHFTTPGCHGPSKAPKSARLFFGAENKRTGWDAVLDQIVGRAVGPADRRAPVYHTRMPTLPQHHRSEIGVDSSLQVAGGMGAPSRTVY